MARPKTTPQKQPLQIHAHSLTLEDTKLLERLRMNAADRIGRKISSSAVMRGILAYIRQQPPEWPKKALYPLIEQEIIQGRIWGSKKG